MKWKKKKKKKKKHLLQNYILLNQKVNLRYIVTHRDSSLGPVVQIVVSLTSSLVVKILTVVVSSISNLQLFVLKNVSSFCKCKSYSHYFSKNISIYAIFDDQNLNDTLTNDIVSFEQLGPGVFPKKQFKFLLLCLQEVKRLLTTNIFQKK